LTTIGAPVARTWAFAASASENRAQAAVGTPAASQISLVKPFDASSLAAARLGPKTRSPASRSRSDTPAARGASGPTITKSMAFSSAKVASSPPSRMSMSAHSAIVAIPALPGATISRSHLGFCSTAQASACSRPPPPRIRMFMTPPLAEFRDRLPKPHARGKRPPLLHFAPNTQTPPPRAPPHERCADPEASHWKRPAPRANLAT
jgi:hypothetical protein